MVSLRGLALKVSALALVGALLLPTGALAAGRGGARSHGPRQSPPPTGGQGLVNVVERHIGQALDASGRAESLEGVLAQQRESAGLKHTGYDEVAGILARIEKALARAAINEQNVDLAQMQQTGQDNRVDNVILALQKVQGLIDRAMDHQDQIAQALDNHGLPDKGVDKVSAELDRLDQRVGQALTAQEQLDQLLESAGSQ